MADARRYRGGDDVINRRGLRLAAVVALTLPSPGFAQAAVDQATLAGIDKVFADWQLDARVPGLVYGIIDDKGAVSIREMGVADTSDGRRVNADTRFRIASMSKAFTALAILKLRDAGRLSLEAPAENYVPELRGWTYPTVDARRIRVRDLLNHSAGFVTDDPWGDRQQPLSEAAFTGMLKAGVPFSRQPGLAMEYSNFGYALLGRIVTNVSGRPYQAYIRDSIFAPLGMPATGHDISRSPAASRAFGYRWQDNSWLREPDMADGVFGAMGGVETSANDYARWVAFLLRAWPPRDEADVGPVARATVREIVEGSNFAFGSARPAAVGGAPCRVARAYGMGWRVFDDCDLGLIVTHSGGYPGYGSNVLLLPEKGIGIFAFANRTYAGPGLPVMKAAMMLQASGAAAARPAVTSDRLQQGYALARTIWRAGDVQAAQTGLAMNFLMDRDAAHWRAELARLRAEAGACAADEAVMPATAMEGSFIWRCERARIEGHLLLAPTPAVALQGLEFRVTTL
jgi:CubicO group peptidase (beta-lactamase class C family)